MKVPIVWIVLGSYFACGLPLLKLGSSAFFHSLVNKADDLEAIAQAYRSANSQEYLPERENLTTIVPGLPGTYFQPIPMQNVADRCVRVQPCDPNAKYRTINGSCNNLIFPMWGLTGTALVRLLPANYSDGIHQPRSASSGGPLPPVRQLRLNLFPERNFPDDINALNVMQWGQVVSHDTTHTSELPVSSLGGVQCCVKDQLVNSSSLPPVCMPIPVQSTDPFFSQYNQTCLNFVRSMTTTDFGCRLNPQQQLAMVTHFVDASFVYGSTDAIAVQVRTMSGGRLKVQRTPDGRDFPPNVPKATHFCDASSNSEVCYFAGDSRVNQNTDITIMHVLFLRLHNLFADQLAELNPQWDDETVYQEARRIVVAAVQRITYSDFLIVMLGRNNSADLRILDYEFTELYDGYEVLLNPTSINDFTTGAYRGFHTLIPPNMDLVQENRCPLSSLRLSDWYFRPSVLQESGNFDSLVRGLATQSSLPFNRFFTSEITNDLFRAEAPYGSDLAAIDIQRGRDHGIPSYNAYRVACGLPRADNFSDFGDLIDENDINLLAANYGSVDDVEYYVAGMLERHVPGALTGPTFFCILAEQFARWRNGDRFYYQFSNQAGSFTPDQYEQLEKLSLALVFCMAGDAIENIQPNVFYRPGPTNMLAPCSSLPQLDLSPWRE